MITLVCTEVTAATAPTPRMSRNSGQRSGASRRRATLRPDRTYQASSANAVAGLQARAIKGYLIGVSGHADTTGDSIANQKLSERRADAVIRYLQRHCNVQPYRILSSVAVGDIQQISNNDTPQGRAANRRVVVQVLTNKGLEGL